MSLEKLERSAGRKELNWPTRAQRHTGLRPGSKQEKYTHRHETNTRTYIDLMLEADIAFGNQISEATLRRSRRRRSRRRRVAAAAALDREEPGESEDEEVKRADSHLDER